MLSKVFVFINKFSYVFWFICIFITNSWKQLVIGHRNFVAVFMTVSPVPINDERGDHVLYLLYLNLCARNTNVGTVSLSE
jgi:hypothetical protein